MSEIGFSLTDKVALVTGASRGIGRGIAKALAEAGADVAGVSRSASTETQALVEAAGRRYLSLQADLATATVADLNALVDQNGGALWPNRHLGKQRRHYVSQDCVGAH